MVEKVILQEQRFRIRDLQMAGQRAGIKQADKKVLALHGWLDNSASFKPLMHSLFKDANEALELDMLALDLFGQGFSEPRAASATYHLWDDLEDISLLVDQLGWQRLSFIGHSRGAMLSLMFAACFPEKVERLILLDGVLPVAVEVENAVEQLKQHIEDMQRAEKGNREPRYFQSLDDAIKVRAKAGGFADEVAALLAERQVVECEQGFYWSADRRLKAASAIKLTEAHNRAFLQAIQCPVTIALASEGMGRYEPVKKIRDNYTEFEWLEFSGHHHFHMQGQVEELADLCLQRLKA